MWKWKRNRSEKTDRKQIPNSVSVAVILSVIALAASFGVARWSWLLLDEQLDLRKELHNLEARQEQVEIQYEFWLGQLEGELDELR